VTSGAATRCWGLVLVAGTALPVLQQPAAPIGPPVPAARTYETAWSTPLDAAGPFRLTLTSAMVLLAGAKTLTAFGLIEGDVLWTKQMSALAPASASDALIFVATDAADPKLVAIDQRSGAESWKATLNGPTTGPIAQGSSVFIVVGNEFRAYRASDGAAQWSVPIGAPAATSIAVDGALAVVGLQDQSLVSIDFTAHALVRRTSIDVKPAALLAADGRAYFGADDEGLRAVVLAEGRITWSYAPQAEAIGAPISDGKTIYFALFDDTLRALDAKSGALRWRVKLGSRPRAGMILADGHVYVPLGDGRIADCPVRTGTPVTYIPSPGPASGAAQNESRLEAAAITTDAATIVRVRAECCWTPTLVVSRLKK
jgi:putative pyrroloquinoline-quinone binding quinoprotein/putative pyrroloquinoline-quinone-binding quinoprotein